MKAKAKGQGARLNNGLHLGQKLALGDWVRRQEKDDGRTYEQLAAHATSELGFTVTESQMQNFWREIHGPRNVKKHHPLETRVMALEDKVAYLLGFILPKN